MAATDIFAPAVRVTRPADCPSPVVISVSHAGRHYPSAVLSQAQVGQAVLTRLGDAWCDLLAKASGEAGAATVVADHARAVADCNRGETDMSPDEVATEIRHHYTAPGRKERAGLGVIPTRLAPHGQLWRNPLDRREMEARLDALHRPYHAALATALAHARAAHGWALLIDLHSMPTIAKGQRGHGAQIVVGDAFGQSCAAWICELTERHAQDEATKVSRNNPYAGGHIIRRHGDPASQVHAMQIEFDRQLYLDSQGEPVAAKVAAWSCWLAKLVAAIVDKQAGDAIPAIAAE